MKLALAFLILAISLPSPSRGQDCPSCAVVTELEQAGYPKPFPKWDNLASNWAFFSSGSTELRSVSYNLDSSQTFQLNNTIQTNNVSSQFISARTDATNSGLIIKGHEFNGSDNWFVLWGLNNYRVHGYPGLESALTQVQALSKAIKQIAIKPKTRNYLILLEDGTVVSQGIPQATLDQLGDVLLIKRVSLSHDGNLAVVRTDGTLVVTGDNLSANQQAFIAMITADIAQQGFQADYLYFGPNKEMIFHARKTGAAYLRHMGPIREQTEITTAAGNVELIQHLSPNYKYQLYRSPDLVTWQKIGPEVTGDNTFKQFTTPMGPEGYLYRFEVTYAAP